MQGRDPGSCGSNNGKMEKDWFSLFGLEATVSPFARSGLRLNVDVTGGHVCAIYLTILKKFSWLKREPYTHTANQNPRGLKTMIWKMILK